MRRRWFHLLCLPPLACTPYGTTPAGDASAPVVVVDAGTDAAPADAAPPKGRCFLCDDFERASIDGGEVPWTQHRKGNVALETENGHLLARLATGGVDQHAYLRIRDKLVPAGAKRLLIDVEYELVSMGNYIKAGDINLLAVSLAGGTETLLLNLFNTGDTGRARISLQCGDDCDTGHTETPALQAIGKHALSLSVPVGPGSTVGEALVDGISTPLTIPTFAAFPADAKVEVRLGADQEGGQTAPIDIRYAKLEIRFDPP